jgi:hypothetical protein
MQHDRTAATCRTVILAVLLLVFGAAQGVRAGDAKPPVDPKKAEEDRKKKEEEKKKKAEDDIKKQDDCHNWKARDYMNATALDGPVCVYIKDPRPKKNNDAGFLEGKDILGNDEVKVTLRAFSRVKIKNDGTDGKGWPADWGVRAENGAVLVLFSSDLAKVGFIDKGKGKDQPNKDTVLKLADTILEYETARKAKKEAKAKEEAARNAPPEKKPEVPGLDPTKQAPEKKKPAEKGPQDE